MPGSDTGRRGSTSSGSSQHSGTAANHLWRHPQSHKVWEKYFKAEAFSSLPIMQYVLSTTDTELTDYLYKPKDLKKKIDMESLLLRPDLDVLYKNPGRCATFAVKVCKELESKHAGLYQFAFFNLGSHRIARCTKTKVVIDSSSDDGAFALRNDSSYMWWESFEQRWKYEPLEGHMYHQKKRGGPVINSGEIPWDTALALSANQMATQPKAQLATLFRNMLYTDVDEFVDSERPGMSTLFRNPGKVEYKAMLRWDVSKRHLECWKRLGKETGKDCLVIYWGKDGASHASYNESLQKFEEFVAAYGIFDQWTHTSQAQPKSLQAINLDVWPAATALWGYPVWRENVDLSTKKG